MQLKNTLPCIFFFLTTGMNPQLFEACLSASSALVSVTSAAMLLYYCLPKTGFILFCFLFNFFNFNFICIHFCIKTYLYFLRATVVTKLKTVSHGNICICMPFCLPWCIFVNKNKFIERFSLTHTCALIPEVLHLQEKWETLVHWLTHFLWFLFFFTNLIY